ncbi:hypothetical protein F5X71_08360 [Nocardia brasiliensis]|uniref:Uncharacterized protein n=1 Tax=Nocardia brasiliensis TaxID=37326 RepID=A0A6G9XNB2_NOCBR|nr:hypothetical protein [Nocardia brasiliensis]QIS02333.1 hypothetical protein F5X71_08360 [Nocardia brasiliensis]
MNHNTGRTTGRPDRYSVLEVEYRNQIITGLRGVGVSYQEIARTLNIRTRRVEATLGEIRVLAGQGCSQHEIARRVGLPRTTVQDLLRDKKSGRSTPRKTAVKAAISDMHGMQLDVLGWFLGMERNHVHSLAKQLFDEGAIHELEQVQAGAPWVVPTRVTAARYLGWRPTDWHPPLGLAEHYRAVAQARVMLVGADRALWVPERVLRHRIGKTAGGKSKSGEVLASSGRTPVLGYPHVHDGRFLGVVEGTYGWWALEVELSKKDPEHMDIALRGAIRAARDATEESMVGVLYLCRTSTVIDNVNAAYERLPDNEFGEVLAMDLKVRDFDKKWRKFLTHYAAMREAAKAESSNRRRRTIIHLSQEAS